MITKEQRVISLPNGGTLEIGVNPGLYEKIREHYHLQSNEYIDDNKLKSFLFEACLNALDKIDK